MADGSGDFDHRIQRRAKVTHGDSATAASPAREVPGFLARDSGQPLEPGVRDDFEQRFGRDFSSVRVHTSAAAAHSARSVNAIAYTFGSHLVFREGAYSPATPSGRQLLAHELAHVVQQRQGAELAVQRWTRDQCSRGIFPAEPDAGIGETPPMTLGALRAQDPTVARAAERLRADYASLIQRAEPALKRAGVFARNPLDDLLQCRADQQVARYWEKLAAGSHFDASHVSQWLEYLTNALTHLGPLLKQLRNGAESAGAAGLESLRLDALARVAELEATPFIRSGHAARERQEAIAAGRKRIDDAVTYVRNFVQRAAPNGASDDQEGRLFGSLIAGVLVNDMRLSGDEIREVLDTLGASDPRTLQHALMRGGTVESLLERGVGGFQAYHAEGEGLIAGFLRGERESLLSNRPDQRQFSIGERIEAVLGFVAGAFQGIGDSIIGNVTGIVSLFTPSFWREMKNFLTEFLPHFVNSEDFRFELGQMLGRFDADEERRLASAEPFEYGRSFGHVFGMALTEIALTFVGLGLVLKAVTGWKWLQRIAKPLVAVAELMAKTALARGVIKTARVLAEAVNALALRARRLSLLLPDISASGRMSRAVFELQEGERAAYAAYQRAQELEQLARKALAAGDEKAAEQHLQELQEVVDRLEKGTQKQPTPPVKEGVGGPAPSTEPKAQQPPRRPVEPATSDKPTPLASKPIQGGHKIAISEEGACLCTDCDLLRRLYKAQIDADPGLAAEVAAADTLSDLVRKAADPADKAKLEAQFYDVTTELAMRLDDRALADLATAHGLTSHHLALVRTGAVKAPDFEKLLLAGMNLDDAALVASLYRTEGVSLARDLIRSGMPRDEILLVLSRADKDGKLPVLAGRFGGGSMATLSGPADHPHETVQAMDFVRREGGGKVEFSADAYGQGIEGDFIAAGTGNKSPLSLKVFPTEKPKGVTDEISKNAYKIKQLIDKGQLKGSPILFAYTRINTAQMLPFAERNLVEASSYAPTIFGRVILVCPDGVIEGTRVGAAFHWVVRP